MLQAVCRQRGSCCVNFRTNTLCDDDNCENGIGCGNRFIETYPLVLIDSACGIGVASTQRIPKNTFVAEYVGEFVDEEEKERRHYPDYTIQIRYPTVDGRKIFIDATKCGNMSRFVNHSCCPNAAFFEYRSDTTTQIGIFTLRDLEPLQEVSVSYLPVAENGKLWFRCRCGWDTCVGRQNQQVGHHVRQLKRSHDEGWLGTRPQVASNGRQSMMWRIATTFVRQRSRATSSAGKRLQTDPYSKESWLLDQLIDDNEW